MAPLVIPSPGTLPDATADAAAAFQILQSGGVIIGPTSFGYALMAISAEAVERALAAKKRREGHTLGILGTWHTHAALHDVSHEKLAMTKVLAEELGSGLAVVARFKKDAKLLQAMSPLTRERVVKGDTIGVAVISGEGPFLRELTKLCDVEGVLLVASSANLTGSGQKFRVERIEPEVLEAMDAVVDHGLQRYHRYGRGGNILDLDNMRVLRVGAAYELLRERLMKWFGVELPEDPEHKTEGAKMVGISLDIK